MSQRYACLPRVYRVSTACLPRVPVATLVTLARFSETDQHCGVVFENSDLCDNGAQGLGAEPG